MTAATRKVFDRLSAYCEERGFPIPLEPTAYRTIYGDKTDQYALQNTKNVASFVAGVRMAMAMTVLDGRSYLCLIGFDFDPQNSQLAPVDLGPGLGVVILSELPIYPSASAVEVFDIVAAQSSVDPDYTGHNFDQLRQLFPSLKSYEIMGGCPEGGHWVWFLLAALTEASHGGSWIDEKLQQSLTELADLEAVGFPYSALCRAVFDLDPRSLFMALCRCLEATYSREACIKLARELNLDEKWYHLAASLDRSLGWHAREAQSISSVLEHAREEELRIVLGCLEAEEGKDLAVSAGKAIYGLRNKIVHFRPGDDPEHAKSLDWNRLCGALALIVRDVYGVAFSESD